MELSSTLPPSLRLPHLWPVADRIEYEQRKKAATKTDAGYMGYLLDSVPQSWRALTESAAHIRLIAEHLDKVERGEIDRLAIRMPPRHGKSETVTYRFPVRWLERNASDNVLVTGYNERFARKFGRRTRNLARARGIVGDEKAAADEWETTEGGLLMTRGVGSPPTGTGFNLIVVDDPVRRREDADSEAVREKTWEWYSEDLYTRLEPGAAVVLIGTAWHHDDVIEKAISSEPGKWTVLRLPALAHDDDPLGRAEGAALWPERMPEGALHRVREVMGLMAFEAQYQQNPTPREGALFKVQNLSIEDARPAHGWRWVRHWDTAASAGRGDYTAGVLVGTDGQGRFCIADVKRGQWSTDDRNRVIVQTASLDGREVAVQGPQAPGDAGKDAAQAFTRMLAGYNVQTVRETGSKELRADAYSAQVNAGNVFLVRGEWNAAFIEEHRQFPNGANDDQVDAAAHGFNRLAGPQVLDKVAW